MKLLPMNFSLNDEQRLLQESVERFIENEYPFERRQEITENKESFSPEIWEQFAELGWLAVTMPEEHGGLGGSQLDVAIIMEAFGRGLVVEPYLWTVVMGGGLLAAAGSAEQQEELIPRLVDGKLLISFAHVEPQSRFNLADVETTARENGGGYVIDGRKSVVFYADTADKIIVSARTAGDARDSAGITLFLLDRVADGISLRVYPTVDGLQAADLKLEGIRVDIDAVLGEIDGALPLIERVVDYGITAVCAEAVGSMDALVKTTQDYLKTRKQFGVPLSTFQVLQHRVVDMFIEHELCKSLARRAAVAVEEADADARARAASTAKVKIGKAGRVVGQQAIQLHGGMGMSDELSVGHHFKRLSMIDTLFGNVDHHLERLASLDAHV